jgi:SagB-type dehydrogenase family enzyme
LAPLRSFHSQLPLAMVNRRPDNIATLETEVACDSLAELYHENSKLRRVNSRQYGDFVSSVMEVAYLVRRMEHSYKVYPTMPTIPLPAEGHALGELSSIERVIEHRLTTRNFSGSPLPISKISKLLHSSYGITSSTDLTRSTGRSSYFRAVPSAGALYPLELYLAIWRTVDLEPGIYHYCVPKHTLEVLRLGDFADLAAKSTLSEGVIERAGGIFLVSAIFRRSMQKYNERGYRFVLLEAGHLAENMCLVASAMGFGILPIGGFLDDELNAMISVDGVNETVIYVLAVGGVQEKLPAASMGIS